MKLTMYIALLGMIVGCSDEGLPPDGPGVFAVSVADVSCTEVWISISLPISAQPRTVALKRDGQIVMNTLIQGTDTILIDEGLLPGTIYTYDAVRMRNTTVIETTGAVQARTMDTTSGNWSFSVDTLGDGASSVLYDVAIVRTDPDSPLVYAVGEIYKRDSLGNWDPNAYNLVKWDGTNWELMRIQFYTICGQTNRTPFPASSITAFSETDTWISSRGGQLARWNGATQTATICNPDPFVINNLWGENPNSVWAVGNNGGIGHYQDGTWHRVQSGTTLPVMDVYGALDPGSGSYEILCTAADQALPGHSQILRIENTIAREVATHPAWEPWGIWFVPGRRYVHAGDGLWEAPSVGGPWVRNSELPTVFKTSICGQGLNDIMVCGVFQLLAHWNGLRWQTYFPRDPSTGFVRVAMKRDLVVAVGGQGNRAFALIGRR